MENLKTTFRHATNALVSFGEKVNITSLSPKTLKGCLQN